jgi:hypothetical protein
MNGAEKVHEWCTKGATRIADFRDFEGDDWHGFATSDLADFPMSQKVAKRL